MNKKRPGGVKPPGLFLRLGDPAMVRFQERRGGVCIMPFCLDFLHSTVWYW